MDIREEILSGKNPIRMRKTTDAKKKKEKKRRRVQIQKGKRTQNCKLG